MENVQLVKGMQAMSEVIVDQNIEFETNNVIIKAYEKKFGQTLFNIEL